VLCVGLGRVHWLVVLGDVEYVVGVERHVLLFFVGTPVSILLAFD